MLASADFASVQAIVPELCRAAPSLVQEIPAESLKGATEIMDKVLPLEPPERSITDLVLLANSERMAEPARYLADVLASVRSPTFGDGSGTVALKAHPRERNPAFITQLASHADYAIPNWVPVELVSGWLSPEVRVHCGMTTFILTSKKLLPGRCVYLDASVPVGHARSLGRWDPAIHHSGTSGPRRTGRSAVQ